MILLFGENQKRALQNRDCVFHVDCVLHGDCCINGASEARSLPFPGLREGELHKESAALMHEKH